MKYNFIPTEKFKKSFKKLLKKYPSIIDDFTQFKKKFEENSNIGADLGAGFRKVRMSIQSKNKGKSSGARIIIYNFHVIEQTQDVLLIDIYDKSELLTMQDTEYRKIANDYINGQN